MAATKLPPRALVGRWGSITSCEAYILQGKETFVRKAFAQIAEDPATAKAKVRAQRPDAINQAIDEERAQYTERMSKAKRSVLSSANDDG